MALTWAKQSLLGLDETADGIAAISGEPTGRVRMAATHFSISSYLPDALASFCRLYPQIVIDVDSTDKLVNLLGEGYDIAYHYGVIPDSRNVGLRLFEGTRILCATPAYLEAYGTPRTIHDLANHHCIVHKPSDKGVWIFRSGGVIVQQPVKGKINTDDRGLTYAMARSGVGIARADYSIVEAELRSGALIRVLPELECVDQSGSPPAMWLIYAHRDLPHCVRLLVDHLVRELPSGRRHYYTKRSV